MITLYPTSLNSNGHHIHRTAAEAVSTLSAVLPGEFRCGTSLACADAVVHSGPAVAPWAFDADEADRIAALRKPCFFIHDADASPPDLDPDRFGKWVMESGCVKLCFYREWYRSFETAHYPFAITTYDLAGYLSSRHPKESVDFRPIPYRQFRERRPVFWSQAVHVWSRIRLDSFLAQHPQEGWYVNDAYQQRMPMDELMALQRTYKIAIALEGAGVKCGAHVESCCGSVMAMPGIDMHWTYPWVSGENCIVLPYVHDRAAGECGDGSWLKPFGRGGIDPEASVSLLNNLAGSDSQTLYNIYVQGMLTASRYTVGYYWRNHMAEQIKLYL